jgi:predicted PurR-regulated permease PerM
MRPETTRVVAVLLLIAAASYLLRGMLSAICWACLIAVSTWPLHEWIQARVPQRNRSVSAGLLTGATVVLLLVPVVYLSYRGLQEMPMLLRLWAGSNDTGLPAPDWVAHLPVIGPWVTKQWTAQIAQPGALGDLVHGFSGRLNFEFGRSLLLRVGHRAMSVFFCILVLFFLYLRGEELAQQFETIVRRYLEASGVHTVKVAVKAVRGTVNGLILVGLAMAVVMSLAYAAAGVPHPAVWGLATGLLGIVPFGAVVVLAVVSVYLLALQANVAAFALLAFGATLIFITDHFVRPLFIAGSSRVPLVLALLGIVGGLETLGILGLFLGPTLMAIVVAIWRELASTGSATAQVPALPPIPVDPEAVAIRR